MFRFRANRTSEQKNRRGDLQIARQSLMNFHGTLRAASPTSRGELRSPADGQGCPSLRENPFYFAVILRNASSVVPYACRGDLQIACKIRANKRRCTRFAWTLTCPTLKIIAKSGCGFCHFVLLKKLAFASFYRFARDSVQKKKNGKEIFQSLCQNCKP